MTIPFFKFTNSATGKIVSRFSANTMEKALAFEPRQQRLIPDWIMPGWVHVTRMF